MLFIRIDKPGVHRDENHAFRLILDGVLQHGHIDAVFRHGVGAGAKIVHTDGKFGKHSAARYRDDFLCLSGANQREKRVDGVYRADEVVVDLQVWVVNVQLQ